MASQQSRRVDERDIHVEKDRVPKMTTHFESIAGPVHGTDVPGGPAATGEHDQEKQRAETEANRSGVAGKFEVHGEQEEKGSKGDAHLQGQEQKQSESHTEGEKSGEMGKFQVHGEGEEGSGMSRGEKAQSQPQAQSRGEEQLSLEEISKLRQIAQKKSAEAIRGAKERYAKEKQQSGAGSGAVSGESTLQNVAESATQGVQRTTQFIAEKGSAVKDTTLEKGQQGYVATKDNLSSAGQTAAGYTSQMAQKTKETISPVATKVKDVTFGAAKKVGSYAGDTAVAAKDVAVGTGKAAAGYAGDVAVGVKDRAVVAGWGAAQLTAGVATEATKAAANVTKGVVGYAADTAVAAKDVVANVGQKAVEYTGATVAQVKDTVVHAEESAKEYAARKKEEAQRELEAKKRSPSKGEESGGIVDTGEQQLQYQEDDGGIGGGVPRAAGETLAEITQTPAGGAERVQEKGGTGELSTASSGGNIG